MVELNEFEQHLHDNYTRIKPSSRKAEYRHGTLHFFSGVQEFQLYPHEFDDAEHAKFVRRLLAKALSSMATDVVEKLLNGANNE